MKYYLTIVGHVHLFYLLNHEILFLHESSVLICRTSKASSSTGRWFKTLCASLLTPTVIVFSSIISVFHQFIEPREFSHVNMPSPCKHAAWKESTSWQLYAFPGVLTQHAVFSEYSVSSHFHVHQKAIIRSTECKFPLKSFVNKGENGSARTANSSR